MVTQRRREHPAFGVPAVTSPSKAQDAKLTFGPGLVNFTPSGTDVTVPKNITATTAPRDCTAAWVTF